MVVLTQEKRNLLEKLSRDGVISAFAFDLNPHHEPYLLANHTQGQEE